MTKMFKEFKDFASKGNVIDLAVGLIVGAAFSKIVSSLVDDIVMPPIGAIIGGVNFTDLKFSLISGVTLNYGNFLQSIFNFLVIAFAVFWIVKFVNKLKKPKEELSKRKEEVVLLEEIRDLLKNK